MQSRLKNFLDLADGLIKFLGFVSIAYVVVTGLAHRAGSKQGEKIFANRRARDNKPNFKALLRDEKEPPFWKDDKLIKGGLRGATTLIILMTYVLLMLLMAWPDVADLPGGITVLMAYPNGMTTFFLLIGAISLKKDAGLVLWLFAIISVVAAGASWYISLSDAQSNSLRGLAFQGLIFVLQSVFISFFVGLHSGLRAADLEERLPLVEVLTIDEQVIKGIRMRSSSETEYRFINSDGSELLIPTQQIRMIRTGSSDSDDKPGS